LEQKLTSKNTTLDDLAAVIGFSATIRLAAWFGGLSNVWVPPVVEEGQLLVRLIGMSAALRMSAEWGRAHIAVPPLSAYEDEMTRRLVGRLAEKGFSTREIARHNRMGERRVQQICRELEQIGLIKVVVPKTPAKTPSKNGGSNPRAKIPQEKAPAKAPSEKTLKKQMPGPRSGISNLLNARNWPTEAESAADLSATDALAKIR
jgi:hypothetical protein